MRRYLAILLLSAFGCRQQDDVPRPAAPIASNPGNTVDPSRNLAPLVGRLEFEARHRTRGNPTAEAALDLVEAAGIHVEARRQFVAATVHARYCVGGTSHDGLAVAACEYETPDAAALGKRFMDARFAAMSPTAKREVHGNTVLTIADPDGVHQDALVSRALLQFAAK